MTNDERNPNDEMTKTQDHDIAFVIRISSLIRH